MDTSEAKFNKSKNQDWTKSDEELLKAVEQNKPEKVATLLVKQRLCPSKLDTLGKSAFHLCISRGLIDCLEVFLSHGVDINVTDGKGFNALHHAAKNGQSECLKRLLQEQMTVDSKDSFGRTSLHHAAVNGFLNCTEILWDFKANLDAQDKDGVTPLMLGAQRSRTKLCAFLLNRGADPNIQDNYGRSALMLACESHNHETVEVLLKGGANPQFTNSLGHDATHYGVTACNRHLTQMIQPEEGTAATEGTTKRLPSTPQSLPRETAVRKRKAPPPPKSSRQRTPPFRGLFLGLAKGLKTETSATSPPASRTRQSNLSEDEEVYEEIRRLRLERGHLLQRIKALEQEQSNAASVLEELNILRQKLSKAEAERDHLQLVLKELREVQLSDTGCDLKGNSDCTQNFLDKHYSSSEKTLFNQSQGTEAERSYNESENSSQGQDEMEQLYRQVEELTTKNAELILKVQMLEIFEKDDTDMQCSSPDFVPMPLYNSLRKEFEELQQKYTRAHKTTEESETTENDPGSEEQDEERGKPESRNDALDRNERKEVQEQKSNEELLAHAKLKEHKKPLQLGVDSMEPTRLEFVTQDSEDQETWLNSDAHELAVKVQELEIELANRQVFQIEELNECDTDTIQQLEERLEEALHFNKNERHVENMAEENLKQQVNDLKVAVAQNNEQMCVAEAGTVIKLQVHVAEGEDKLKQSIPHEHLEEVQLSLCLQLEQLTREQAKVAMRLNDAVCELKRVCHLPHTRDDGQVIDDESENGNKREQLEGSDQPTVLELSLLPLQSRQKLVAVVQELEAAVDCLCAERECHVQDFLKLTDAVPLAKYQEMLFAISQQLCQTEQKLQAERALREDNQAELAKVKSELQTVQHGMISKEENEKISAELQHIIKESKKSAAVAQMALIEKETELKMLSQKTLEQNMVSENHEAQRLLLQVEINTLTAQLADLNRKHEKTCTEVFQVQREALFNKSERHMAEAQLSTVQQQLADLQAQSTHIQQLHENIQHSQELIKEKDHKITELSKEVFRLKEALGALTPPLGLFTTTLSCKIPGQQKQVSALTQQLQDWENKHKAVVATYRSQLLAAVQGRMDEDAQALLLQILKMTQNNKNL